MLASVGIITYHHRMTRIISLLAVIFLAVACVPTDKLTYLQEEDREEADSLYYALQRTEYHVQPNDILNINVRTYDEETARMFNIQSENTNIGAAGDIIFYLRGYSVDLTGNIDIPVIGKVNVQNKTIEEVKDLVQTKLDEYFKMGTTYVSVQLAGVRFSVVGEVARPGKYTVYQNQVNIFEALATAGDITIVGDRNEVYIVRQRKEGVITYELDLTDANVLSKPEFFIQPNDIINVKPLPQKSTGIGTTGFQTFASIFGVLASTVTLVITIVNASN